MNMNDLIDLAIDVTKMTRERWDSLCESMKSDQEMNRIMREEWHSRPRDSDEAIREYYRDSDIWFINTFLHGAGALIPMAHGDHSDLPSWAKEFVGLLGPPSGKILDFGGGFFKDTWPFISAGYRVDVAEVSGPVTRFLSQYRTLAGLEDVIGIVEVDSSQPLKELYDGVTCFETLEHLAHPVELTQHLYEHINPGKPFAFSASFGAPEHAPYHVASNARFGDIRIWGEKLKEIGFLPHWSTNQNHLQIWRRS